MFSSVTAAAALSIADTWGVCNLVINWPNCLKIWKCVKFSFKNRSSNKVSKAWDFPRVSVSPYLTSLFLELVLNRSWATKKASDF